MSATHELLVQVKADTAQMKTALDKADKSLTQFGKAAEKVEKKMNAWNFNRMVTSLQAVTSMASGVISSVSGITQAIVEYAAELDKASAKTGISVEQLSALRYAAEQSGSDFETLIDGIKTFSEQLGAAQLGDQGAIDKLGAVGVDWIDYYGKDGVEQLKRFADHLAKIPDTAERTRTAIEAMGDAGFQLTEMLAKGSAGIEDLEKTAEAMGLVVSEEKARQARELSRAFAELKSALMALGVTLIPVLEHVTAIVEGMAKMPQKLASGVVGLWDDEWAAQIEKGDAAILGAKSDTNGPDPAQVAADIQAQMQGGGGDAELTALLGKSAQQNRWLDVINNLDTSKLTPEQQALFDEYRAMAKDTSRQAAKRKRELTGDLSNTVGEGLTKAELELAKALSDAGGNADDPAVVAAQEKVNMLQAAGEDMAFQKAQGRYARADKKWTDFKDRWNAADADTRLTMLAEKDALETEWKDAAAALKAAYPTYEEDESSLEEAVEEARSTPELSFSSTGTFSGLEAMNQRVGGDIMEQQLDALQKIVMNTFEMANSKFSVFRKD